MSTHRLLYRPDGRPRTVLPGLAVLAATVAVAVLVQLLARRAPTDDEHARALSRGGHHAAAEAIYERLLGQRPSVPLALEFIANHDRARASDERVMPEDGVEVLLARLPRDISLLTRFVRESDEASGERRRDVEAGARREPPVPWYNHVLAGGALSDGRPSEAAAWFEREGLAFPERRDDVTVALELWMSSDEWDVVRRHMSDARVLAAADAGARERFATHERDWPGAAKWTLLAYADRLAPWSVAMAAAAALAWGFFCARLGKVGERPGRRLVLYGVAFALGVLSVAPAVLLVTFEEAKLRLVETGEPARDILFFVFGVGLREEGSKLLLFAALLPALRRWGDKLDVLVCGAMVGLGFAAEENLGYLASGDLHAGISRFLTANFFHMALTATLAAALADFAADPERQSPDLSRAALTVIGLHGAYDFLLSHEEYGGAFLAMAVLFFVGRLFLEALDRARRRVDRGLSPLHAFVFAVAVVTGVSAAHAAAAVGPARAAAVMAEGLAGEAVIVFVFVRSLRGM